METLDHQIDLEAQHDPFNEESPIDDEDTMLNSESKESVECEISKTLLNPRLGFIRKVYGILTV
jgi:hypothetical protein